MSGPGHKNGACFNLDRKTMDELMKKKEEEEERKRRAEERVMKVKKQTETLRSSAGGVPHISDMRIVLLGNRREGKSSCGNTILGRQEFQTAGRTSECVKREGETAGRHITVVEAPGWYKNFIAEKTPEREKREIVLSVSLCPPGPHALLLVIRVDEPFTETFRRAVQEHLELLGERVWSHTIVLFTKRDWLRDTSGEQHIESGGKALQWVVEKCGNRYHVLDNKKSDGGQVTELLEKIEEMVTVNSGHHFGLDNKMLITLTEKKKEDKRRAEQRKMKVQKQKETLRSSAGGVPHISDMRIVLLGAQVEGKSSCGNTILGRQEFRTPGRTSVCVKRERDTAGRHITVVEAPGWWANYTAEQTPEHDKQEIVLGVSLCPPGPHALLLVTKASKSFIEKNRRAVQEHLELLGERVWSHTIVLFTRGDCLGDTSIEQHIEGGGKALQWVVEKCGNRYHVLDNLKSDGGQVTDLLEKIEEMVTVNSGHHFGFDNKMLITLTEKNKEEKRRAEQRKMKVQKQREILRSSAGDVPHISDIRIVLLGSRYAGKSSCGNTILGRQEFQTTDGQTGRTAECVKREGEKAGRHITVVEAPGWWINYTLQQTPEHDKQEIVRSVSLCPPGPHALLLVIHVSKSFTEQGRRVMQEHLELLGERVWSHTIVLFTCGDWLGDTSIEEHIESGGEALQWVVEKCGNRYHVLDNLKSDGGQVTDLLEKIEEMVTVNSGHHFGFDNKMLITLTEKNKEEKRRAEQRKMKVQKQREILRSSAGDVPHISDIRIVLLGSRYAGKSSCGNTILGRQEFQTTDGQTGRTAECVKREGEKAGRHITVVEAPGWWINYTLQQTPEHDKQEIVRSVSLCPPGPHALLLVIHVSKSFTEQGRRVMQEHLELLGERVWSHTIVLFTCGDWLGDTSIEEHIESGGEALQWVVEKCGNRYHVLDNERCYGGQVTELLEKIEELVALNSGENSIGDRPNFSVDITDDLSREDSAYGSAKSAVKPEITKPFMKLKTTQHMVAGNDGDWSMDDPPKFSGDIPDGLSREDSAYGSAISAVKPEITKPFMKLKTTQHMVAGKDGEWSAHGGRPNFSEGNPDDFSGVDSAYDSASALQSDVMKPLKQLSIASGFKAKDPFVDISTIAFDVTGIIGRGSYGVVYRGSYQGTPAAVKVIDTGPNPVLINEVIIPWRLSHPNIVRMMGVAKCETQILIANEYIHGANLQQVLHTDTPIKLQQNDKLFVALDLAMAIEYIHGKHVIHQDLKPANIMVAAENKKAYLTDWGLANLMETVTMSTTGASNMGGFCGALGGTPQYMAPECFIEFNDCSAMSDMWSLGITLLEMFTDSKPWSNSKMQELRRLVGRKIAPPAMSKLQQSLHDIVAPLLQYDPKSRMNAKDLTALLKTKVDLTKRYGHGW